MSTPLHNSNCSTSDLTPVKEKIEEGKRKQRVVCTGIWKREVFSVEERRDGVLRALNLEV